jgi:putative toxin-antitoxin system antitoxin component (TIGR02293 family)
MGVMNTPSTQIESVMKLANDVFEDQNVASEWLKEPNIATDEKPPLSLLGTDEGFNRVATLLHRIEYGILT